LSAESAEEAEVLRAFINAGHHVIVVTDSTKFHQTALVRVAQIEVIHTLVTDNDIPVDALEAFQERGIFVERV
jgi:DeoR/GlpR family transcriptional regulator of sugar metabolism